MKRTTPPRSGFARAGLAALALLAVLPAGCASSGAGSSHSQILWEAHDQFIRLEAPDIAAPANSQPANVTPAQLRPILNALRVTRQGEADSIDLLSPEEVANLSDRLAKALAQAKPGEDVTFASIGLRRNLLGLKEPRVTAARMFLRDGKINLIFGDVHAAARESDSLVRKQDARLEPYLPGRRGGSKPHGWRLSAPGWIQPQAGRDDWLVADITAVPPAAEAAATTAAPAKPGAPAAASPASGPVQPVEERLRLIEDLFRKGLIEKEEYFAKRRQIIDSL